MQPLASPFWMNFAQPTFWNQYSCSNFAPPIYRWAIRQCALIQSFAVLTFDIWHLTFDFQPMEFWGKRHKILTRNSTFVTLYIHPTQGWHFWKRLRGGFLVAKKPALLWYSFLLLSAPPPTAFGCHPSLMGQECRGQGCRIVESVWEPKFCVCQSA